MGQLTDKGYVGQRLDSILEELDGVSALSTATISTLRRIARTGRCSD